MTMDRVHLQHSFQQLQQQQQQPSQAQHNSQHHQPILSNSTQPPAPSTHIYRHNHQNHTSLRHHQIPTQSASNPNGPPPILHRPLHPPPPPPPQQRVPNSSSSLWPIEDGETSSETSSNVASTATATMRSAINATDYTKLNSRHSMQHHYYVNTYYQLYRPSKLHTNYHQQDANNQQLSTYKQNYLTSHQFHSPNEPFASQQMQIQPALPPIDGGGHAVEQSYSHNNVSQDQFSEEIIQAILAAKEALEKPIEERDERDILLIDNLCSLVHGFDVFPRNVRRALAAQAVLIVIDEKGKELIVNNEELDSFCVLIFGECEQLNVHKTVPIRYYNVGDSFGVCELTTDIIRFVGYMITRCENCAFLCVKRDDFYTILTDPANYPSRDLMRHRDRDGNVICVSQFQMDKKTSIPPWTFHMHSANPFRIFIPDGHIIVKATEACLLYALVDGYDRVDQNYVDDFLLLFRVFMAHDIKDKEKKLPPGMIKLCLTLAKWLDQVDYRDRVVKIVLTWLSSYYHDFELNSDFSYLFFKVLESRLLNLSMNDQLHLLHVTLSTKSKTRHVTITRSSREQPLTFSISGGYEKNCGIFVTHVYGSNPDDSPSDSLMNYLRYPNSTLDNARGPVIPPRHKVTTNNTLMNHHESRISNPLRPGDQILEVNGTNFSAIKLVEAQKKLDISTHLSLTVKYNPSAFYEMRALREGQQKSSSSSLSSVSPFQPPSTNTKFTFMNPEQQVGNKQFNQDSYQPASPLFSSNANFGFRSIINKTAPKNDRSRLQSLGNKAYLFVKQIRDSTVQSSSGNIETMSKTSGDTISDDQSSELDSGKAKSNPDLPSMKGIGRQIESGLSNMVRLDDLNPASITEHSSSGPNQLLVNVLRVFNAANNDFRYLLIHEETTAREVVMVAVKEFNLTGNAGFNSSPGDNTISWNWHLYEVSVVPESKTIKQKCIADQTSRLAERASLCSRFYIKSNSQSSFGDDALVHEILKDSPASVSLTSLNATLLAVELTLIDFDKFRCIEPQQFVYDTFFDYSQRNKSNDGASPNGTLADSASIKSASSDGQETDLLHAMNKSRSIPKDWMAEYQEFADISNREMFWVVCEILNERNIGRRVKIVKQFVRVADVCSQLRNYNSMFAIISGLGHSCVNRLRRTFEKLKPKYKNQLEKMRSLFDPSKNMSNYRTCLNQTPPPAIPLFPQIKKDLTFTKEGRTIFIRENNDLSDDDSADGFHSQDTIKRKTRGDLLSVRSSTLLDHHTRPISYTAFNNRSTGTEPDSILVNFAEIRQFTERVRNVIYFSSVPYSNDLLTNTKENQRTQAQIKKMHEEWQMRKRIRHYIDQTLTSAMVDQQQAKTAVKNTDQTDGSSGIKHMPGSKLNITYDERVLYQRSLEVEPEMNTTLRPVVDRTATTASNNNNAVERPQITVQLHPPNQPQTTPAALNMHPPSASNSSPTLSKSSSLSSCSSFNHHLPNYHAPRNANLTSSVGKFGTESTESLRKLQALSENVDDWRPYNNSGGSNNMTGSNNGVTNRLGGDSQVRSKGVAPSRMFPPKNGR